jgi:hypothetical protein
MNLTIAKKFFMGKAPFLSFEREFTPPETPFHNEARRPRFIL